jgi:hypothetical protein
MPRRANLLSRPGPVFCPTPMTEEYLTIEELSARLKIKPKTVKNKMASGIFLKGVHYFSPAGFGPRFKWSAIVAWVEETDNLAADQATDAIPMARGYLLGRRRQ